MDKPEALHKGGIAPGQGASTLDSGTTLVPVGAGRGTVRGKRAPGANTPGTDTVTRGRRVSALLCRDVQPQKPELLRTTWFSDRRQRENRQVRTGFFGVGKSTETHPLKTDRSSAPPLRLANDAAPPGCALQKIPHIF